ncbi:hypothetical protein ACFLUK_00955 [Chloroflexota bacterium]
MSKVVEKGPGVWDVSDVVDAESKFKEDATAKSADDKVKLDIKKDTVVKTKEGKPISLVTITPMEEEPPAPPEGAHIIGLVYDIDVGKATFDELVTLTLTYDPALIPKGVSEEDLVLALWDEDTGEWVELPSIVNPETNTISAEVTHLSKYAVFATTITPPEEEEEEVVEEAPEGLARWIWVIIWLVIRHRAG